MQLAAPWQDVGRHICPPLQAAVGMLQSQWGDAQGTAVGTKLVPSLLDICSQSEVCPECNGDIASLVTKCLASPFQMCNAEQVLAQARKRKRRTSIETNVKGTLESFFRKCVKPSPQEISQIAEDLNLDKDVGWESLEDGCPNGHRS